MASAYLQAAVRNGGQVLGWAISVQARPFWDSQGPGAHVGCQGLQHGLQQALQQGLAGTRSCQQLRMYCLNTTRPDFHPSQPAWLLRRLIHHLDRLPELFYTSCKELSHSHETWLPHELLRRVSTLTWNRLEADGAPVGPGAMSRQMRASSVSSLCTARA